MDRKYLKSLETWLNRANRKPLIVWGARQVGKTYLLRNLFAETHFRGNYIYIDCRMDSEFTEYCSSHFNVTDIINYLSLKFNMPINASTLLIFDEVQECLPILTLLKYFCQEHREIPVIATGSMVRMKIQRTQRKRGTNKKESFLFPVGNINQLTVYPLTFDEYLYNKNHLLYATITTAYRERKPLEKEIHSLALDIFYTYLAIGGMPEAVDTYLKTGSEYEARLVLKDVYDNYLGDMELYQASPSAIVRAKTVFNTIYRQLNKENKNIKWTELEHGSTARDFLQPLDWLLSAFIIEKSSLVKEHVTPPLIESSEGLCRLYLSDIGMFTYQSGINAASFLTNDGRNMLSGIFYENYVANELTARDIRLFYWKGKQNAEFEFLIESNGSIIPLDTKKKRGKLTSLSAFCAHNSLTYAIKVSANNFGYDTDTKVLTIPYYMFFCLADDLATGREVVSRGF